MKEVLSAKGLTKRFPGVLAVDNVGLTLGESEVLALVGENGAGKSTLMKMLCGVLRPDSGELYMEGKPVTFHSVTDAMEHGVSIVYQELSMVQSLSVAENLFANRQPTGTLGQIQWKPLMENSKKLLERFRFDINPRTLVKHLSMGWQQLLEILKAISVNPKVLILDEPTSSLTEAETLLLFETIRALKEQGMSFIYISHKLDEIFQICNRVMVMRDGAYVDALPVEELDEDKVISMMVGRKIKDVYGTPKPYAGENTPALSVQGLTMKGVFENISFTSHKGEILGFSGLVGAGRTEMAKALIGEYRYDRGELFLEGKPIRIRTTWDAVNNRIAYLTEDRKNEGLYLRKSVRENLVSSSLGKFTKPGGWMDREKMEQHAREEIKAYKIAVSGTEQIVGNLSGGNQQKCLISQWFHIDPGVIIFDEPTRGVDVGARFEIYELIHSYTQQGGSVLLISSELPELIGLCDRILVMWHGTITGEFHKGEYSQERIMECAAGLRS